MLYKYVVKNVARAAGPDGHVHAQADLRRQRLGHARPPVALEGRRAAVLRRDRLRRPVRHRAAGTSAACSSTPRRSWPSRRRPPTATSGWSPATRRRSTWSTASATGRRRAASRCTPKSPKAKRVEFRCPDPSCNPYLAFSAMLMAGLDGVQNKIEPPDPVDKDLYDLPPEELAKVPQVPGLARRVARRPRGRQRLPQGRRRVHRRPHRDLDRLQAESTRSTPSGSAPPVGVHALLRHLGKSLCGCWGFLPGRPALPYPRHIHRSTPLREHPGRRCGVPGLTYDRPLRTTDATGWNGVGHRTARRQDLPVRLVTCPCLKWPRDFDSGENLDHLPAPGTSSFAYHRRVVVRGAGAVLVFFGVVAMLGGCSAPFSSPVATTGFSTHTATMSTHARLRVEDTSFSPGVGDSWSVVVAPNSHVATVDDGKLTGCSRPGCHGTFAYTITAQRRGTTKVVFQYCYRSAPGPACMGAGGPGPVPVVLTVSVS